jgi:chemotaxis protein methyltransferase CheR
VCRAEMSRDELVDIELTLLLEAIYMRYGHDFRSYSRGSIKRRVRSALAKTGYGTISEMISPLLHDESFFAGVLHELSITVSEMFRDPPFFRALRDEVVPYLKTHPFVRIWHAGCATGEEVYSLAIVLRETGLEERATVYATDFNDTALSRAREGIYPLRMIKDFTSNYQRAGGTGSFAQYYHADYDAAVLDPSLRKNIVFANHNLVTDGVFSEMHLVVCRNVMIYFDRTLQEKVVKLFCDSLVHGGILALGSKESLRFSKAAEDFRVVDEKWKIYKKLGKVDQ